LTWKKLNHKILGRAEGYYSSLTGARTAKLVIIREFVKRFFVSWTTFWSRLLCPELSTPTNRNSG
jgi:hypothetical protein